MHQTILEYLMDEMNCSAEVVNFVNRFIDGVCLPYIDIFANEMVNMILQENKKELLQLLNHQAILE